MVIERYRNGDPGPVYRRFRERGRMAPDGLTYVSSWVSDDMTTCYQLMETPEPALLEAWMAQWRDLVDFEAVPVMTSQAAAQRARGRERGRRTRLTWRRHSPRRWRRARFAGADVRILNRFAQDVAYGAP